MRRHLDNKHANSLIHGNSALVLGASEHWAVIVLVREGDVHAGRRAVGGGGVLSCLDLFYKEIYHSKCKKKQTK